MMNALRTAATGMNAQETKIDGIANDLANVNTVGYKRARAEFEDLYYEQIKTPGVQNDAQTVSPNGIQVGHGTKLTALSKVMTNGNMENTSQQLDMAVQGNGFFQFVDSQGNIIYSRNGVMQLDRDGNIVNTNGLRLEPQLTIPPNTLSISVARDGTVSVITADQTEPQNLGQIQITVFQNPSALEYKGANLFGRTQSSGDPINVIPGLEGSGVILQGFVETSNVNIGESLISMVVAQRSYESNTKVIETADRMMQTINNIL